MASKPRGPKADKLFSAEVQKAVNEYYEDPDAKGKARKVKGLRLLARKLVKMGIDGEVRAIREVADRLDGRPPQGVEMTGPDGAPVTFVMNLDKS